MTEIREGGYSIRYGISFLGFLCFLLGITLNSLMDESVKHDYGTIVQKGESCRGEYRHSQYSCKFV